MGMMRRRDGRQLVGRPMGSSAMGGGAMRGALAGGAMGRWDERQRDGEDWRRGRLARPGGGENMIRWAALRCCSISGGGTMGGSATGGSAMGGPPPWSPQDGSVIAADVPATSDCVRAARVERKARRAAGSDAACVRPRFASQKKVLDTYDSRERAEKG